MRMVQKCTLWSVPRNRPKPSDARSAFQRASDTADGDWASGGAYTAQAAWPNDWAYPKPPPPPRGYRLCKRCDRHTYKGGEQKGWCDECGYGNFISGTSEGKGGSPHGGPRGCGFTCPFVGLGAWQCSKPLRP